MESRNTINPPHDWDAFFNGAKKLKENNKKKIDLIQSDVFILKAAQTAAYWHQGQFRKYGTQLPYIIHPIRVAGMISIHPDADRIIVAASYLHDTIEDTNYPITELYDDFGEEVYQLVMNVTNPSKGSTAPRNERKKIDRDHLSGVSKQAKLIKLVDRIDNLWDLIKAPYDFVQLYLHESRMLLDEALRGVDEEYEREYERAVEYIDKMSVLKERYEIERNMRKGIIS